MKSTVLITAFLLIASFSFAQQKNTAASQEVAVKPGAENTSGMPMDSKTKTSPASTKKTNTDVNDEYMGKKEEILRFLKDPTLPKGFPKYKKGTTEKEYNYEIENYLRQHHEVLNERYLPKF